MGKRGTIEPFDIDIKTGEILGFAGLLGSGRSESAKLIFGIDKADHGTYKDKWKGIFIYLSSKSN